MARRALPSTYQAASSSRALLRCCARRCCAHRLLRPPSFAPACPPTAPQEERCDPETELCRTPIHVWESRCTACDGTGTARQRGGSRGRRGGGSSHRLVSVCLLCHGLGYVRHSAAHDVPHVNGAGPHTTLARPPAPEHSHTVRRFIAWSSAFGGIGSPKKKPQPQPPPPQQQQQQQE